MREWRYDRSVYDRILFYYRKIVSSFTPTQGLIALFIIAFLTRSILGFYYAYDLWLRKPAFGFNPFLSGEAYLDAFRKIDSFRDSDAYNTIAKSILERFSVLNNNGQPTAFVGPLYPLFLSIMYGISGFNFWSVLIPQAALSGLTCIMIYYLGKHIFNSLTGLISALLNLIHYKLNMFTGSVYSETLYLFLLALSLLLCVSIDSGFNKVYRYILVGVLLGLTVLCRSVFIVSVPLIIGWIIISEIRRGSRKVLRNAFVITGVFSIIVGSWVIRNTLIIGRPILTSDSSVLWFGNNPSYDNVKWSDKYKIVYGSPESRNYLSKLGIVISRDDDVENTKLNYAALTWIRENPIQYVTLCFQRFLVFWGAYTDDMSKFHQYVSLIAYLLIFPLGLVGLYYARKNFRAWLFILFLVSTTILHSLTIVDPYLRLRLPNEIFLSFFTAYAVCELSRGGRSLKVSEA